MKKIIQQFISYFFVGGISAIVEWIFFALFANFVELNYLFATCLAFVFSTATNWFLGRKWTFKGNKKYIEKPKQEVLLVYFVSAIGLVFNILLMYLFVTVIGLNTSFLKTVSKILATGIVFFWNFFVRKLFIYKEVN